MITDAQQSVTLSEMVVTLSGRNTDQLTFASKNVVLQPGPISMKLHCPVNTSALEVVSVLTRYRALHPGPLSSRPALSVLGS
jgi:hypothetical protein